MKGPQQDVLRLAHRVEPHLSAAQRTAKRVLDVALSLLALLVLGVPMLAVAVAIRLGSPGGAISGSTARAGRAGPSPC